MDSMDIASIMQLLCVIITIINTMVYIMLIIIGTLC